MSKMRSITRVDLTRAIQQKLGLSPFESRHFVEQVLAELCGCMVRGETVKLSGFGSFTVRRKGQRVGRNPATREEVPITARRVVVFKASNVLKQKINARLLAPGL
jgi:integration host factor subunit alpha